MNQFSMLSQARAQMPSLAAIQAAAEPEPRARGQRPDLPDGFDHFGCSKCKKQAHGCTRCKTFADKQEKGYQWLNGSIVRKVPQEAA